MRNPFRVICSKLFNGSVCVFCLAEAAAPPDEALLKSVSDLEGKLLTLTQELQQRRESIPGYIAQRLEEQNKQVVGETVAEQPEATAEAAENAAAAETRIAPAASGIQICTAVTTQAHQATSDVQRALDQASDMASQLKAINDASSAACATETDRVITQTEKENSSDAAADIFRRRREVAQAKEDVLNLQASKMPRLL